jgi:hypothetical protein
MPVALTGWGAVSEYAIAGAFNNAGRRFPNELIDLLGVRIDAKLNQVNGVL